MQFEKVVSFSTGQFCLPRSGTCLHDRANGRAEKRLQVDAKDRRVDQVLQFSIKRLPFKVASMHFCFFCQHQQFLNSYFAKKFRMEPQKRVETLQKFAQRVIRTEAVTKEMKKWNLEMLPELVRLKGRLLPPEEVSIVSKIFLTFGIFRVLKVF